MGKVRAAARWFFITLLLFAGSLAFAQQRNLNVQKASGNRVALVIGNDSYRSVEALRNARADARAMAAALTSAGFAVTMHLDADEKTLKGALRTFKGRISGGDEAVFYYSGHGVQLGTSNYLLPVDIRGESEDQIKDDAVPLQRVLDDLQDQKARFSLAIVDACRNNPFRQSGRALGGRGLAPTSPATGQMVIYSAGTGQQALDRLGDADRSQNGLFTRVLLREMNKPGVPVNQVLRNVREEVVRLAKSVGHEQVPAMYDQALGDFYFRPGSGGAAVTTTNAPAQSTDSATLELAYRDSIKGSQSPVDFDSFLQKFPNGTFAAIAKSKSGYWIADSAGCKVYYTASPPPADLTMKWNGKCSNGRVNGPGTLEKFQGDELIATYEANYVDGLLEGKAVVTGKGGYRFDGFYKADKREGPGKLTFANGLSYEGNFRDDKRSGKGKLTFADGGVYEGDFQDNKRSGKGKSTYANGNRHEGEYLDDKLNGRGVYTYADGRRYDGEFRDDKFNGRGTHSWSDGRRYDGEFRDGNFSGRGVYAWSDGRRYDGEFRDGKPNGSGTFTYNGNTYAGTWTNGCFRQDSRTAWVNTTKEACGF